METPASGQQPVVVVCIGMAGSGKTTFMQRINAHLHQHKEPPYVVNLDPAVLKPPFESNIDIRDSVNYKKVMQEYNLGPNGGILTSLNLFATKIDQVIALLEKRAAADPTNPSHKALKNIIVDTPGQIEVFVWSASGQIILDSLASSFPTVIAYIIDTPRTKSTSTFMSNMLYACSIMYKTKLPMILVFNKTDVQDASFAREWMTDYNAFQEALDKDAEQNAFGGVEGAGTGSGAMQGLIHSMSLMLDEFYSTLSVVSVSSVVGTGINDFFKAVEEKADEFRREYQPELDRKRQEREEAKKKQREKELDKMMKGMSMGGSSSKTAEDDEEGEEEIKPLSSDEDDDDDIDEEDPEGLQARYEAAMREKEDSTATEASFVKYLHSQR